MTPEHHGELTLRRFRIGELPPEEAARIADHVPGCEACRGRLAAIDAEAARFREEISFERFAAGVASAGRTAARRPRVPRWVPPAMALAAAAGVILAVTLTGPAPRTANRVKGGGPSVDFYVGGLGTPRLAGPEERLEPGERVRIGYRAGRFGYLTVVSVDDTGEVSRLYPAAGASLSVSPNRAAETLLPRSVAFTGHGPERVIVVLTRRPIPVSRVAAQVRAAWHRAGGDVTRLGPLDLPGRHFHGIFLKP